MLLREQEFLSVPSVLLCLWCLEEFLNLSTIDILCWIIPGCGDCSGQCRVFSHLLGLHLLKTRNTQSQGVTMPRV